MKKSEIDIYIRKYILPNHKNYFVDQYVMYRTFGNDFFLKGYLFYSKGDNEMGLKVSYFVIPLFVKEDRIAYTLGDDLTYMKKVGLLKKIKDVWWDVRKESQDKTFKEINETIENKYEPILNKFNEASDYFRIHKKEKKDNIRVLESITYSSILFESFEFQNKLLNELIIEAENERSVDWVHQIKQDALMLLNTKDQLSRIEILKKWANETIAELKLPHLNKFKSN